MVFRDRRPSRHRAVPDSPADATPDAELESYLAAITPESDSTSSDATGRFGAAQVFQVRLPGPQTEQLRRLADARGVPPISLVIDWVLERLEREGQGPSTPRAPVAPRARRAGRDRGERGGSTIGPLGGPPAGLDPLDPRAGRAPTEGARLDRGPLGPGPTSSPGPLSASLTAPETSAGRFPDAPFPSTPFPPATAAAPAAPAPDPALASLGAAESDAPLNGRMAPLALFGEHDLRSPAGAPSAAPPRAALPDGAPGDRSALPDPGPLTAELPPLPRDGDAVAAQFSAALAPAVAEPEPAAATPPSVTPIFRAGTELPDPDEHIGPRHRAPEPVTSLLTRRKF
jgi:hypothetical protein